MGSEGKLVADAANCLSEDELLALAAGSLGDTPQAEQHLSDCSICTTLLAGVVRAERSVAWNTLSGSTLGPYRIDSQIGAGGMGAVYLAWDSRLERALAVKVLHGEGGAGERLEIEARAAAAVEHRAIVSIHDVGMASGMHYVAMELVEGESMRSMCEAGALGLTQTRDLMLELAEGLAAAHAQGVVHRDLKPENLVMTRDGLKILDFGLARVSGAGGVQAEAGIALGTAGYMAPEQIRGEPGDERADLFAVGAIAYEAGLGRRAFAGGSRAERLSSTLNDSPEFDGLGDLAPLVGRCLEKEPRDRFHSAADLAWTIRTLPQLRGKVPRATGNISRRAAVVGATASVAVGTLGYLLGSRREQPRPHPALRPLTHRTGRVYTARFTADGGRAVYGAAWDENPVMLHVVELASGETTLLDLPSADLFAISARGDLAISAGHRFVDHQSARGQLTIVPLAGGESRPLESDVQGADFEPADSPPGRAIVGRIAVVRAHRGGFRIELPVGTTLVEETGWITHARIAPEGARVAYLHHPHTNDDSGALKVVETKTREPRVVTDGWVSIAGLVWAPSGDGLWFTGSRASLTNTLFHTTLDGQVTAARGSTESRMRIHDMAQDGRGLVTRDIWRLRAMVATEDRSLSDLSYVSDLSADGSHVVVGELGELEVGVGAYLVPYTGGRPMRLGAGFPVAISPSGRRIAANESEAHRLVVYSTDSGSAQELATPGFVFVGRWLDERSLIGLYDDKLWRLSLDAEPVVISESGNPFALDSARQRLAYIDSNDDLVVLELRTGTARAVGGKRPRSEVCGWLRDADAIAVRSTTTPIRIDRVDPQTGQTSHLFSVGPPATGLKAVDSFVLHSGGERYAYSFGQELSQLYLMTPVE